MPDGSGSTPKVTYQCTGCGRPFSILPGTVRKVLVAVAVLSAPVVAGGIWALTLDTGSRNDARALRLVIPGLILFLSSVLAVVRDALRRRAAPVISRF